MDTIREWRNEEWESDPVKARAQSELQYMARRIIENADSVTNEPTPGYSDLRPDLSRLLTCKSSLLPNVKYLIHLHGFTVEDIIEVVREEGNENFIKVARVGESVG